VLQTLKDQGLIKAIGVAGGPIDLMLQFVETDAFDAVLTHNRYNLINRSANTLIEAATKRGMAVLNAAVYGGGMLAKGPDNWGKFAYREASTQLIEVVRQIEGLCQRFNVSLGAAALQFSLRDPRITSTVVGMTRAERVKQTVALAQEAIPDEFWSQVEEVVARANLEMN
jgi:D-threo-aldose 1-dehydrogenase